MAKIRNRRREEKNPLILQEATLKKLKSVFLDPTNMQIMSGIAPGIRSKAMDLSFQNLRLIAERLSVVNMCINCREQQIVPFLTPSTEIGMPGFVIAKRGASGKSIFMDDKRARLITDMVQQTGFQYDCDREDDFVDFGKMLIREVLTIDQVAIELQRNRKGQLAAFWLIDGGTVSRVLDPEEDAAFVQEIESQITAVFGRDDLIFDYMYKRADLKHRGFGYCLSKGTRILTDSGYKRIEDLDTERDKVFNGTEYSTFAKVHTGQKAEIRTTLDDGTVLRSSAEHQIKCCLADGTVGFLKQKELSVGDYVVCKNSIAGTQKSQSVFTPAMCEVLGWLLGDGCFYRRADGMYGQRLFYYTGKDGKDDREALVKHVEALHVFGLTPAVVEDKQHITTVFFGNQALAKEWVALDIPTTHNRHVAEFIFAETDESKRAFLRGLFSADGHVGHRHTPILTTTVEQVANDVHALLLQLGIANTVLRLQQRAAGFSKAGNPIYEVVVEDRETFANTIGFIQTYKNNKLLTSRPAGAKSTACWRKRDLLPAKYAMQLLETMQGNDAVWHKKVAIRRGCTVTADWFASQGVETESFKKIVKIEVTNQLVDMYDLEIKQGEHQLVADGVYVHNSLLEQSVDLITTLLLGITYNRDIFTKERIPKGFIALQGEADDETIEAIARYWNMAMTGADAKFRVPIIPSGKEGVGLDFKMLSQSNRDMEYNKLMLFFLSLFAGVFSIDLAELGIKTDNTQQSLGENIAGRVQYSKDRGLGALLGFLSNIMTKIVRKVDKDYDFTFTGLNPEDDDRKYSTAAKAIASTRTINEVRKADGLPPLDGEEYNMVLNPVLIQARQLIAGQQQQPGMPEQGAEAEQAPGSLAGEDGSEDDTQLDMGSPIDESNSESTEKSSNIEQLSEAFAEEMTKHLDALRDLGYDVEVAI